MKSSFNQRSRLGNQNGQALVLFCLFSIVLILFVGMAIDMGFAYVTKAQLSKGVDAGALAAVSNYSGADKGAAANTLAINTFNANYATNGVSGRATGGKPATVNGTWGTDANGNLTYTMTASTTINTYFIGLLPQWKTLTVGDTAVADRAPVVMTLVLDRSGSMDPNGTVANCQPWSDGGAYLPSAVTQFINIFDETLDRAACVTFAVSSSNDVPMSAKGGAFKTPIINTINRINTVTGAHRLWAGGTCTISGLTNALVIENNAGAPANAVKVVVLFTDGQANMTERVIQGKPLNFGGMDPIQQGCQGGSPGASFWATNAAETYASQTTPLCTTPSGCNNVAACVSNMNNAVINVGITWTNIDGVVKDFCAIDITEEATNRCVRLGNQLRATSNYVYAVGLYASEAAPTLPLLQQVANDPGSPQFDPTQPIGAAFLSSGQDLSEVFQQVAADIILRLVR
jgi:Flp pilus assembly protein TadG